MEHGPIRWVCDRPHPFRGAAPSASTTRHGRFTIPIHQRVIKLTRVHLSGFYSHVSVRHNLSVMNIHDTKMAEPLLPPSRFCREMGCQGSLSSHPLPLSLLLTFISIMENKPAPEASASLSFFCFPLPLPNLCTQRTYSA